MVQILERQPSKLEGLLSSLNQGGQAALQGASAFRNAMTQRKERESLASQFGEEFKDIRDPALRSQILQSKLKAKEAEAEAMSLPDYETVKDIFGEKFANLYKAAPTGGKTKALQYGFDALERGENINSLLGGLESEEMDFLDSDTMPEAELISDEVKPSPKIDFAKRPKGFTNKEWAQERKEWAKQNTEQLQAARKTVASNRADILSTKKLQQLSKNLPEGLEKWLINPETGEFYKTAQLAGKAPVAAQEWTKVIARFGNRAKEAFGSRVTNFDLVQYMKQFPSLLNTKQGRDRILRMMEINYELDGLYDRAVQSIIDEYGESKIPPAQVDKMARKMIKKRTDELEQEFLSLEDENSEEFLSSPTQGSKRPSLEEIFG